MVVAIQVVLMIINGRDVYSKGVKYEGAARDIVFCSDFSCRGILFYGFTFVHNSAKKRYDENKTNKHPFTHIKTKIITLIIISLLIKRLKCFLQYEIP